MIPPEIHTSTDLDNILALSALILCNSLKENMYNRNNFIIRFWNTVQKVIYDMRERTKNIREISVRITIHVEVIEDINSRPKGEFWLIKKMLLFLYVNLEERKFINNITKFKKTADYYYKYYAKNL